MRKAKPPDHREIEVGITSGPEDAPDVLLEREAVEIGKNETYRSLCARLLKKNNFNIVNLKNLEGNNKLSLFMNFCVVFC